MIRKLLKLSVRETRSRFQSRSRFLKQERDCLAPQFGRVWRDLSCPLGVVILQTSSLEAHVPVYSCVPILHSLKPGNSQRPKHDSLGTRLDLTMSAYASQKEKGDYKLVVDQDGSSDASASARELKIGSLPGVAAPVQRPWDSALPVAAYCASSILMTVVNKYVVSGKQVSQASRCPLQLCAARAYYKHLIDTNSASHQFNMNFLLLAIQSIVCVACVSFCKSLGFIEYRSFDREAARKWFPISFLLCAVIYTGSRALQSLSIPVYTVSSVKSSAQLTCLLTRVRAFR